MRSAITRALVGFVGACAASGCGASAVPLAARGQGAVLAVQAPPSREEDPLEALADGLAGGASWYCSGARGAQRYEVLQHDGAERVVRAVGLVLGNVRPEAPLGPVEVRVQRGHGVTAPASRFVLPAAEAARVDAPSAGRVPGLAASAPAYLYVLALPEGAAAAGSHVQVRFLSPPRGATARCVGELLVYPEASAPTQRAGEARVRTLEALREDP